MNVVRLGTMCSSIEPIIMTNINYILGKWALNVERLGTMWSGIKPIITTNKNVF